MTVIPQGLAHFFDQIVPFLDRSIDVATLSQRLGPSPSAPDRLAFYQTLIQRDKASILNSLYPLTQTVAHELGSDRWQQWVAEYCRDRNPDHWDPNPFGLAFPDYLEGRSHNARAVPGYLVELADFEWITYVVGVLPDRLPAGVSPPSPTAADGAYIGGRWTLFVRSYAHDIPLFAEQVASGQMAPPAERTRAVLVYRDPTTLYGRALYPTAAALAALGRRRGQSLTASHLSEAEVTRAEQHLVELGVLS